MSVPHERLCRFGFWHAVRVQIDAFWEIIGEAQVRSGGSADGDEVARHVSAILAARPAEQIIDFAVVLEGLQDASYRWDLWAAAYLIKGGCSDDSFDYFRGWLIAQGRRVWEAALADPDSLADIELDSEGYCDVTAEEMLSPASVAYGMVTGDEEAYWEALPERPDGGRSGEPAGDDFDFDDDDEMRSRLPRLSAIHLHPEP
jgi:hypothetical protein